MLSSLVDRVLNYHGPVVYLLVAGLVFAEDALFVGFVLPGETAAVLGGVVASRGGVSVVGMIVVVVFAAIVGDSVGYEVGRHFGTRILSIGPLAKRQAQLTNAQNYLQRKGGSAVFFGRFIAFFRAVMPALAGISRMPYGMFLPYNAAGGIVWGTGFVLLGYFAGNSYKRIESVVGKGLAVFVLVLVVVALVVWQVRKRRAEKTENEPSPSDDVGDIEA